MPKYSPALTPEIRHWRRRNAKLARLKPRIMAIVLDAHGGDVDLAKSWLKSPHPLLLGKTPLALLKPIGVGKLYSFVRKHLLGRSIV